MIYNVTVYAPDDARKVVEVHTVEGVDEAYRLDAYFTAMGYAPQVMPDTMAYIKKYPPAPPRRFPLKLLP